ncbi:MAG: hypothetical protein M1826_003780 [Phylliscum demangeonii]|nr:MAG: hypothetical protein M1826_003780 [Phylliscum demangeonii]
MPDTSPASKNDKAILGAILSLTVFTIVIAVAAIRSCIDHATAPRVRRRRQPADIELGTRARPDRNDGKFRGYNPGPDDDGKLRGMRSSTLGATQAPTTTASSVFVILLGPQGSTVPSSG